MNAHTLRSTLSILSAVIGLSLLNAPAWSADTARKGALKGQQGRVKYNDVSITKGERHQPGDTPAGQGLLNNKNPELNITSPRDSASGQATGQFKEGGVNDMTHIVSPRDSQSGLPHGIVSPRDSASGLATGK